MKPIEATDAQILAVLKQLKRRLKTKEVWCQGSWARTELGAKANIYSGTAKKFDLHGALLRDYSAGSNDALKILNKLTGLTAAKFNDSHTYVEVFAKIDSACALVEARIALHKGTALYSTGPSK